ncbi:unnamed protein product [Dibothriocephalus latus]|uniref:Uncharacterized protein n=1 Tax=Dibothriocephalus latus TaxID=60516 RepID=A0A3P7MDW1_DIBLA|nr:unnamed protein product [Dibothriocephalus latus]
MVLVGPSPALLAVIGSRFQCFACSSSTVLPSSQHRSNLPKESSLHRTVAPFTPSVEADPELNVPALSESVRARGLFTQFPETLLSTLELSPNLRLQFLSRLLRLPNKLRPELVVCKTSLALFVRPPFAFPSWCFFNF